MSSLNTEQLFIDLPIPISNDICMVYPLSVFEIFKMTSSKYNYYLNLLTMSKGDIEEIYEKKKIKLEREMNPFEYLMLSCQNDDKFLIDLKKAFFTFIRERVEIIPESGIIIIGNISEKRLITKENFKEIQSVLRQQNGISLEEEEEEIPENEDPMHKKFRERRKQLARAKRKQAEKNAQKDDAITTYAMVKALIVAGIIQLNDLNNISLFKIRELFDVLQAKEQYDNQIAFLCAGADPKKNKIEYWIKKTYKD